MLDKLKERFALPSEKWDEYASRFNRVQVPARTILLHKGQVSQRVYLIEKGCLRVWFNNRGTDVTFQFFFENQTVSSFESFRNNTPSMGSIETIEPCMLWWIHKRDVLAIFKEIGTYPAVQQQLLDTMSERTIHYMELFQSFVRDTPQQRYENLLAHQPHIVQRVPQHYIASYLGISSVHLSRIKRKIARGE